MMNGAEDAENAGDDDDDRYDAFYVFPFISMMSILPATWQTLSGKPSAGSSDFNWLQVVIENQIVGNLTFDTQSFETITQKNPTNPAHISYVIHTHTCIFVYTHTHMRFNHGWYGAIFHIQTSHGHRHMDVCRHMRSIFR